MARSELRDRTLAELTLLEEEASRWVGTPWMEDSATPGVGVSCHRLVVAIYVGARWFAPFEVPRAPGGWARFGNVSRMRRWLQSPEGARRFAGVEDLESRRPGDLCLMLAGRMEHHLAIVLPEGRHIHAPHSGVEIAETRPVLLGLVRSLWRPIPEA